MSRATTRQEIADALSSVDGIHGHTHRPNAMLEGDAWPQWRGSPYAGGQVYTNTWVILVVLPTVDDVTADSYADAHGDALLAALREVMFVDSLEPAEITADGNNPIYALSITGRSE